jgi:3-hydroxy-9,10-secoandrosta-1,3,5(10)-triene-9,17-dione monooxygenase reductase component
MNSVTAPERAIDGRFFRKVLGHYPTGVSVVTAIEPNGSPVGMVVGTFSAVSLAPMLVAFMPDKSSRSWAAIEQAGRFRVSVLGTSQLDLCNRFATRGEDKFAGLTFETSAYGTPVLKDVVAWVDCEIECVHEAGDHVIVIGRVLDLDVMNKEDPLLFLQGGYGGFAPLSDGTDR